MPLFRSPAAVAILIRKVSVAWLVLTLSICWTVLPASAQDVDLEALDSTLAEYMDLDRRFPFDFFAAVYCLRIALVARHGQPGWPAVSREMGRRSLERFVELWEAHSFLPDENVRASPAAWARRELGD